MGRPQQAPTGGTAEAPRSIAAAAIPGPPRRRYAAAMSPLRAALIDLAGVLHLGDTALPGAAAALQRLRDSGLALRFLTNTTRKTRDALTADLQSLGFALDADEIVTAASAAQALIGARGLHPHLLIHPGIAAEFADRDGESPDCVLLGDAADGFSYAALDRCFRILMEDPQRPLIAMAKNRYFRGEDGLHLDMGPFVAALEAASGRQALVTGKPSPEFFEAALAAVGVPAQAAVMVGDDWEADIAGAAACGIRGLLVRSGKYQAGDETKLGGLDAEVVDDFAAAVDLMLQGGA